MGWEILIAIFIVFWLIDKLAEKSKQQTKRKYKPQTYKAETKNCDIIDYAKAYHRVSLLTAREQKEYQKLKMYADQKKLLICPKVRLLDLVTPRPGSKNYQTLLHKVMSKHVDFVICSQDMQVLGIIELDDTTHNHKDRIERDAFVDTVLRGSGYKIIHTWEITVETLDRIINETPPEAQVIKITSPTGWTWNENTKLWEPPLNFK